MVLLRRHFGKIKCESSWLPLRCLPAEIYTTNAAAAAKEARSPNTVTSESCSVREPAATMTTPPIPTTTPRISSFERGWPMQHATAATMIGGVETNRRLCDSDVCSSDHTCIETGAPFNCFAKPYCNNQTIKSTLQDPVKRIKQKIIELWKTSYARGWGELTHPQTKMESECNPTKSNDGQIHWEQHFLAIGNRKRKPLPYETRKEDQRCDLKTPSCICHWCCSHHQLGDLIGGEKTTTTTTTTTTIKLLYKERFKTCRNKIQRTLYLFSLVSSARNLGKETSHKQNKNWEKGDRGAQGEAEAIHYVLARKLKIRTAPAEETAKTAHTRRGTTNHGFDDCSSSNSSSSELFSPSRLILLPLLPAIVAINLLSNNKSSGSQHFTKCLQRCFEICYPKNKYSQFLKF